LNKQREQHYPNGGRPIQRFYHSDKLCSLVVLAANSKNFLLSSYNQGFNMCTLNEESQDKQYNLDRDNLKR
jgi:hypothetical protein